MGSGNNKYGVERRKVPKKRQNEYLERKSAFRIDYRQRLDLFAKTVLVTTGGALTISMTLFLKEDAPSLSPEQLSKLTQVWFALLYTLASFSTGMFITVLQGFYVNSNWTNKLPLGDDQISGNLLMKVIRVVILLLGITGFGAFIYGLCSLGFVATEVIETMAANKTL
ncbi:hypothetical protein Q4498_06435 [Neptunomonas phycophila]|uniref:hypothetical protein n=1 Tax=Neptunomonas phycophila TaxID=1572645 RepID=UPI0026E4394E|nr:hypothetical protein [Neptunomonas phycophila]MDO6467749.1 hypothetical protein [Neptunomonas phycophila]